MNAKYHERLVAFYLYAGLIALMCGPFVPIFIHVNSSKYKQEQKQRYDAVLNNTFKYFDTSHDGQLNFQEYKLLMRKIGFNEQNSIRCVDLSTLDEITKKPVVELKPIKTYLEEKPGLYSRRIDGYDVNKDGEIDSITTYEFKTIYMGKIPITVNKHYVSKDKEFQELEKMLYETQKRR